jgi:nitric oxide dioxygenase
LACAADCAILPLPGQGVDVGVGFSSSERALVARGFDRLSADWPAATVSFYGHLFRLDPSARDLFVLDLARQGEKLVQTLELVVSGMHRWGLLRESVVDLAIRHLAYGVRLEQYRAAESALLLMLRERLGPGFTPAAEAAWRRLIGLLCETMTEAAYPLALAGDNPD